MYCFALDSNASIWMYLTIFQKQRLKAKTRLLSACFKLFHDLLCVSISGFLPKGPVFDAILTFFTFDTPARTYLRQLINSKSWLQASFDLFGFESI